MTGWSNDTVSNRQQLIAVRAGDDIQRNTPNVHTWSSHTAAQEIIAMT